MLYNVKLDLYEGPIDLLLQLVRRGDLDISQIPIAEIAREYFEWLQLLEVIDLAQAGEFIAMTVSLLKLKLNTLLPSREDEVEVLEPAYYPSSEEYLRFKQLADELAELEASARALFSRPPAQIERERWGGEGELALPELLSAFKRILEVQRRDGLYTVAPVLLSVDEKMEEILQTLKDKGDKGVPFMQLFRGGSMELITTFLAILELIRLHKIRAAQPSPFEEIVVYLARSSGAGRPAYE